MKEKESLAHQRSVVNAGEMFQLSYNRFLGGSFRRGALFGSELDAYRYQSPIYAGRRYCCTGRWEAVVDFYRDAIVIGTGQSRHWQWLLARPGLAVALHMRRSTTAIRVAVNT